MCSLDESHPSISGPLTPMFSGLSNMVLPLLATYLNLTNTSFIKKYPTYFRMTAVSEKKLYNVEQREAGA